MNEIREQRHRHGAPRRDLTFRQRLIAEKFVTRTLANPKAFGYLFPDASELPLYLGLAAHFIEDCATTGIA